MRLPIVDSLESRRLFTVLPSGFVETQVVTDLSSPTAMTVAPDGRLFVAEQGGRLLVVKNGQELSTPFLTVSTPARAERGLLGVTLDPNFSGNGFVYVYYTVGDLSEQRAFNRISRFTADPNNRDRALSGSERVLFELDDSATTIHQGGALHFGRDGKLYVAVGDHGGTVRAQELSNEKGKILRLNPDGSIPTDNPFYTQASGKYRAIWARGLRNPYTFAIQPGTGLMYINDVGETTWEEVNEGRAGANYGWPESEGPTSDSRFTGPVHAYHHNTGGKAIVGGTFYNPPAGASSPFPSSYAGDYLFSDYGLRHIRRLDPSTKEVSTFATGTVGRTVDLDVGPDGSLYYLTRAVTDVSDAGVYRIRYTGSGAPAIGTQPRSQTVSAGQPVTFSVSASGTAPLSYQWQRDAGSGFANIAGATASSYTIGSTSLSDSGDRFRVIVRNGAGSVTSSSATLTVTSNRAPVGAITSPSTTTRYSGGSTITFAGTGTDAEDGSLPASAFTWRVDFHHDDHTHPFVAPFSGQAGGTFTVPRTGEVSANVWYRIHLTVRDADGLTHSTFRDVQPRKATVTLASSVPGIRLTLDGQPVTGPHSVQGVAGMQRSIGAPATQTIDGRAYEFTGWSDGSTSRTRTINWPSGDRTYTANYRLAGSTATRTLSPLADASVRSGTWGNTNFGSGGQLYAKESTDADSTRRIYLKFDLSSLATIGTAKLRLFGRLDDAIAGRGTTVGVYGSTGTSWTESGLTWNNSPSFGTTALATASVTSAAAKWYEWDLTSYLRQQKAAGRTSVTLVLKTTTLSKEKATFNSDEATTNRPQLVVTV